MGSNDKRIEYLENVVNDLLVNRSMSNNDHKEKSAAGEAKSPAADSSTASVDRASFELVAKKYDVQYEGRCVRVTADVLVNMPELLAFMREKHPACFKK